MRLSAAAGGYLVLTRPLSFALGGPHVPRIDTTGGCGAQPHQKYRKELWNPFIAAVKRYELIAPGDRIAVCISGGKDSMVLAKLMQELQRHTEQPFELVFW